MTTRGHGGYWATVAVFWVVAVGVYEGGYNHTLYGVRRLLDASGTMARLYPAGDALISNDVFFQGISRPGRSGRAR